MKPQRSWPSRETSSLYVDSIWNLWKSPRGDRDSTRTTKPTNLDPWGLPETETPTKEHIGARFRSPSLHTAAADMQLNSQEGPPITEQGLTLTWLSACGSYPPNQAILADLSRQGYTRSCSDLWGQSGLVTSGNLILLRDEGDGGEGSGHETGRLEEEGL